MSTENTQGIFKAFEQIMSKGNVQAEELRNQLGDRLPTAVALAAKSMGLTMEELDKRMKAGALKSKDFMLPFSQALREMSREGNALEEAMKKSSTAMKRFGTSVKLNILQAFDSGAESGLAEFFNLLSTATDNAAPLFRTIGRIFGLVIRSLSTIFLAVQQIARPMMIAVDYFLDGTKEGLGILRLMSKVAAGLVALILYPFAKLEQFNNKLHKSSAMAIAGWGLLSAVVTKIIGGWVLKILGIKTAFTKVFGFLNIGRSAFFTGLFKNLTKLMQHPAIKALLLLTSVITAYNSASSKAEENTAQYQRDKGSKELSWWDKVGVYARTANQMLFPNDSIDKILRERSDNMNRKSSGDTVININTVTVDKPADIIDKNTFLFYANGGL